MGLFQRSIQKKAAAVDTRRWQMVPPLKVGEQRRHNTPAKLIYSDCTETGYLFLTDRRLLWAAEDGSQVNEMPFAIIKTVTPDPDIGKFRMRLVKDGEQHIVGVEMYRSQLSVDLYNELIDRVQLELGIA